MHECAVGDRIDWRSQTRLIMREPVREAASEIAADRGR
jgi:hypothetical protein